jgi:GNAT superfamily N-acetyltransferase
MTFGDGMPIAAVPMDVLDVARTAATAWTPESIRDPHAIRTALGPRAGEAVGPAMLAYRDEIPSAPVAAGCDVRLLAGTESRDVAAVAEFRQQCPAIAWEHGGSTLEDEPACGAFVDGRLVALAGYERWGDRLAHIAIVTHPAYRGRGLGRAAVHAITVHLLERGGLVPQYRTLESNVASIRIAKAIGFVPYAASMAVRMLASPA